MSHIDPRPPEQSLEELVTVVESIDGWLEWFAGDGSRRERVATAAMAGILAHSGRWDYGYRLTAADAVQAADALIAELDKPQEVKP